MYSSNAYQIDTMLSGWTRIDMLLALYDRAIISVRSAQEAEAAENEKLFAEKFIDAHKCVLAIHGGLKPEECEMSFNIARLLHFIMTRISEHNFDEAVHFLEKLRSSFEAIREEATALERAGKIPSLELSGGLNEMA